MREFETTIIIQPEISDEGIQAILGKLDGSLESAGALRLTCEDQGKRKLAYEIRKFHKGHYFLLTYLDDGRAVPGLERALRMEESVLRFLTVRTEDEVLDIESRKKRAAEFEADQQRRAEEKAAREAEEAKARAEVERAAAEEARAQAAARSEEDADSDSDSDSDSESDDEESDEERDDEKEE